MTSPDQDSFAPYAPSDTELRDSQAEALRQVDTAPTALINPTPGAGKTDARALRTTVAVELDPQALDTLRGLRRRFEQLDPQRPAEDNRLKIASDWRTAVMTSPALPRAVAEQIINAHNTNGGLQLVLCDNTPPANGSAASLHQALTDELVESGMPASRIRFARDYPTATTRSRLIDECNNDRVSVLINPTGRYSVDAGTYARIEIAALHHVDVPFRPDLLENRENTIRQADPARALQVYTYSYHGSPDALMWEETVLITPRSESTTGRADEHDTGSRIHDLINASVDDRAVQAATDVAATQTVELPHELPVQYEQVGEPDLQ